MAEITDSLRKYILYWEGGLSNDPKDTSAAKNPSPYEYKNQFGWHTNKGITYATFKYLSKKLGFEDNAYNFLTMPNNIWDKILAFGFWNPMLCYKIKSNYIANIIVDFAWGSGVTGAKNSLKKYFANKGIDVNNISDIVAELNKEIKSKGETIVAMDLINHRKDFLRSLKNFGTYGKGWFNRLNSLIDFKPLANKKEIAGILIAFFFLLLYKKKLL